MASELKVTGTWCPQCGPGVMFDEDGCCATCGCTAVGQGAEKARKLQKENERLTVALRDLYHAVIEDWWHDELNKALAAAREALG